MHLTLRWLVIVVFVCGFGASVALADNPLARPSSPDALAHLDRGNALYNTRSFAEAISEFKEGAIAEAAPVFDYNLGQAYRQLEKYQDALWHYDRFLTYGQPKGQLLDAVKAFMAEMRAQLANRARTMPPTGLGAGTNVTPAAGTERAPLPIVEPNRGPDRPVDPPEHGGSVRWFGWTMTGAGVVAIGTAGLLVLSASNLDHDASVEQNFRTRDDLFHQRDTRNLLGAVVGVGGVVLTATGVIWLITRPSDQGRQHAASIDFGINGHGAAVFGRF